MSGDCCKCHCDTGRLPYTLTVNASGFEKCSLFPTDVAVLSVAACFGSGGLVRVTTDTDYEGSPVTRTILSAELLEPGSGYAVKGRVQPTIELTAPTLRGADCTFTPTFTEITLKCSECLKWWTPNGATIECDGDYTIPVGLPEHGTAPVSMRVVDGCATVNKNSIPEFNNATATLADSSGHPMLTVNYHRCEPTLTSAVFGGTGAELTPALQATAGGWAVASVTVDAGGSGYQDGQAVQFSTPHLVESPAAATIRTVIAQPQMAVSVLSFAGGTGAALSATMSQITVNGRPRFVVSGVTIQSGGSGYAVGDEVRITTTNGQSDGTTANHFVPPPRVSSVSGSGSISGISFAANDWCEFWRDTGVVESVTVTSGGAYCLPVPYEVVAEEGTIGEDGTATQISLMYAEDDEAEPCVASPFAQYFESFDESYLPCAVSTANDATFGGLESVTIANSTYSTGYYYFDPNGTKLVVPSEGSRGEAYRGCIDGEHVLVAEQTSPLVTFSVNAGYGSGAIVLYGYASGVESPYPLPGPDPSLNSCWPFRHAYQQRVAPTVTASNGVTVTLAETVDDDGLPAWTISQISAAAGCGEDGAQVQFFFSPNGPYVESTFGIPPYAFVNPWNYTAPPLTAVLVSPTATIQADENNVITGVTLDEPGLFYRKFPWDGQPGEIQRVTVVNGGSGYAVIGREQPQSFSFSPSGAWTPTLEEHDDAGRPYWTITDLAIPTSGGYADGQTLQLQQSPPEFSAGFQCIIRTKRQQPSVSLTASGPSGSGATFAVTLESTGASPPNETWRVAAVTVTNGGSAYFTLGTTLSFGGGVALSQASATPVIGSNGVIAAVTLTNAGEYYGDSGIPDRVEITNGGKLWRNNSSLPSHVANVTVAVEQVPPSEGSGAELQAVIDDDPSSETFGQITAVTVVNGGSNYTPFIRRPGVCKWRGQCPSGVEGAFGFPASAEDIARIDPAPSVRLFARSAPDGRLIIGHVAPYVFSGTADFLEACEAINSPPREDLGLMSLQYAAAAPTDCSSFAGTAVSDPNSDGTFTVSTGGVPEPEDCLPCFSEPCPGRPATLSATASVSITVPNYPNAMGGNIDLPVCCQGEHSAEDIEMAFSCNDSEPWLSGFATLDKPGGCTIDTSITCDIKLVQDEACDLFLEVSFTGNCKERYEEGGDVFERAVVFTKVVGPLATTTQNGLLVPSNITDLDISFDEENDYPATISVTFTT